MMMNKKFSTVLLSLVLAACAHAPQPGTQAERVEQDGVDMEIPVPNLSAAENEQSYPKQELSSQMLYTFLLADIAAQRGQVELAAQAYLDLAKTTRDLRVARRAAQLAYESHQMELALESLKLWQELDPKAVMPKQMLVTVLISGGKLEEAQPYLAELLAADADNAGRNIVQVYPLLARYGDKMAVYKMLQALAQPYLRYAEMH